MNFSKTSPAPTIAGGVEFGNRIYVYNGATSGDHFYLDLLLKADPTVVESVTIDSLMITGFDDLGSRCELRRTRPAELKSWIYPKEPSGETFAYLKDTAHQDNRCMSFQEGRRVQVEAWTTVLHRNGDRFEDRVTLEYHTSTGRRFEFVVWGDIYGYLIATDLMSDLEDHFEVSN